MERALVEGKTVVSGNLRLTRWLLGRRKTVVG